MSSTKVMHTSAGGKLAKIFRFFQKDMCVLCTLYIKNAMKANEATTGNIKVAVMSKIILITK